MLEVYPIQEKKEQENICAQCGVEYDVEKMAYSAYVDKKLAGVLQFSIHADSGYIYDIANVKDVDNQEALFVMGRGALNFIDLCNVKKVYFDGDSTGKESLLEKIGFKYTADNKWFVDLNGFFDSSCTHNSEK